MLLDSTFQIIGIAAIVAARALALKYINPIFHNKKGQI
jgi:hypothetical protein